jgi:histidine ammonia-lyase
MAAHGARRLGQMNENLARILGVELLCAAQGIDFRAPLVTSAALQKVVTRVRQEVETMGEDRYLAPDLERAAVMITSGGIVTAAGIAMPGLSA